MITKEHNAETVLEKEVFDLVNGTFSTEDAAEILYHLIDKKITFHQARNLSSQLRFGTNDEASLKRLAQLKEARKTIDNLVARAREGERDIRINAQMLIELL